MKSKGRSSSSFVLFVSYCDLYTGYGNQAETLTGRVAIWTWALEEGSERPWLGHGFDSLWKVAPVFGTFEARHAENELLQQFYTLGIAGLVLMTGCYSSLWRRIQSTRHE
jgi:exopolysaccharide production protein ExoQ